MLVGMLRAFQVRAVMMASLVPAEQQAFRMQLVRMSEGTAQDGLKILSDLSDYNTETKIIVETDPMPRRRRRESRSRDDSSSPSRLIPAASAAA